MLQKGLPTKSKSEKYHPIHTFFPKKTVRNYFSYHHNYCESGLSYRDAKNHNFILKYMIKKNNEKMFNICPKAE